MWRSLFTKDGSGSRGSVDTRRAVRHRTNMLACDLGRVVDLSRTGVRIECNQKPPVRVGQIITLTLEAAQQRIAVQGRVVWLRRTSLRGGAAVGVHFVNIKQSLAAALESMALFGFVDLEAAAQHRTSKETARTRTVVRATLNVPNHYEILGLAADATTEQVHDAYRALARQYHPDVAGDCEDAEARFIEVTLAYRVLRDAESRADYNAQLNAALAVA